MLKSLRKFDVAMMSIMHIVSPIAEALGYGVSDEKGFREILFGAQLCCVLNGHGVF